MIRFLFRFAATLALAIAVVMGVIDAARTIAASALVLTPLSAAWSATFPQNYAAAQAGLSDAAGAWAWQAASLVLDLPGAVLFLALAAIFYAIGRRPRRRPKAVAGRAWGR